MQSKKVTVFAKRAVCARISSRTFSDRNCLRFYILRLEFPTLCAGTGEMVYSCRPNLSAIGYLWGDSYGHGIPKTENLRYRAATLVGNYDIDSMGYVIIRRGIYCLALPPLPPQI